METVEDNTSTWSAVIERIYDNHVVVKILSSPESIVAKWKIEIDTKLQSDGAISYCHPILFYLLFNPWCPLDSVYIEGNCYFLVYLYYILGNKLLLHEIIGEDLREEYIMLDTGLIWRGSYNRQRPSIWKYAQYEKDILDCSLYLVSEIGKVKTFLKIFMIR